MTGVTFTIPRRGDKAKLLEVSERNARQNRVVIEAEHIYVVYGLTHNNAFRAIILNQAIALFKLLRLLESQLLRQPRRYNVLLKDDKSYPWIVVTNEMYPRVFLTRQHIRDGSRYYGPYTNTSIDRGNTTMKGGVWDTSKRLLGSEVFPPELSAGEAASALLRTYGCGCE